MKKEVKAPVFILVGIIALGLLAFGFNAMMKSGNLDQGQVPYTPGVPPWLEKDPNKKPKTDSPNNRAPGTMPGTPSNTTPTN